MNKIIFDQLKKVQNTSIDFNENSINIFIPKTLSILNTSLKKGKVYIIKLEDQLLTNDMLSANWNSGKFPTRLIYTAEVIDVISKMIKINGVSEDGDNFYGWIPIDQFKIISTVN